MKVLVVDDSIVFRSAIVSAISSDDSIEVVRSFINGKVALDYLVTHPEIDLITLDMEMPVLDGMETIKEIRKFNKRVVIIVFSAHTQKGAEKTIEALNAGANDFVTKPENLGASPDESINSIKLELLPKIQAFRNKAKAPVIETSQQEAISPLNFHLTEKPKLILIGSSTGGPEALTKIFKSISGEVNVPILLVQHMPPLFTQKLAESLSKLSSVQVLEAKEGDKLRPGVCYIAPGDYHMVLNDKKEISLNQNEKVCFVRPSVDVLFQSVAQHFNGKVLSIVLTGMGEDGAVGAKILDDKGAYTFVQDKESSVVWGMPGSVKKSVVHSKIIALENIGTLISLNSK